MPRTELQLSSGALVISDLHLEATAVSEASARFERFLDAVRARSQLWILGDLFDAWVGPAHARLPGAALVVEALQRANDAGLELALVPGNRDFLLDDAFTRVTGVKLYADGILAKLPDGSRALLIHGDELCTLDRGYQRLKSVVRSRPARWLAPRLPDALALGVARRLRKASTSAVQAKPAETKRQQAAEVRALAAAANADCVVCGHAHEFRDELLDGGPRWIVLDAFGGPRDVLEVTPDGGFEARSSAAWSR
ncbi:MAG TPA: UDP-2,3-diacylglucosamine diphosphatase [Planctomycetota bacterium]|nr:UDP-2,3-diacylglucosamine diphosphatase [Planctomycetota bacterium]